MSITAERTVILLIEDEPAIADTVLYALHTDGYEALWCATAAEGLAKFEQLCPALVILDIGLPDANGFEVFRTLRQTHATPVIFLTARGEEIDRVAGLEMGADDYVSKPFSPRELSARVRAVLRRSSQAAAMVQTEQPPQQQNYGPFSVDQARLEVRYHEQRLALSRYEYRLLLILLNQMGRVYSREQLLQLAWNDPEHSIDRTVDTHIKTLRAKLRAVDAAVDPIKTHRGIGYSLSLQE